MQKQTVELHDRIDQMLTEARVVLPGAQAMLGFQLIVTLVPAFEQLPDTTRNVHFLSLAMVTLSIAILLAPAAIHRLGYDGEDDDRFYRQGSALVTAALAPLALGIAGDIYVAMWKLSGNTELPAIAGSGMLIVLLTLWYFWPLIVRARQSGP